MQGVQTLFWENYLWSADSACRLMMLYISIIFHEHILNAYQLYSGNKTTIVKLQRGIAPRKLIDKSYKLLVICTSSNDALYFCADFFQGYFVKSECKVSVQSYLTRQDKCILWLSYIHLNVTGELPSQLYDPTMQMSGKIVCKVSTTQQSRYTSHQQHML